MSRPRICYISSIVNPFTSRDFEILKAHFDVTWIVWRGKVDIPKVIKTVYRSDLTFCWFADNAGFAGVMVSTMLGRKSVVVAGGYDVVDEPSIQYGRWQQGGLQRWTTKFAFEHADLVLSVSKSNQKELLGKVQPRKNILVYNGVPVEQFSPGEAKRDIVITVGNVVQSNLTRKGLQHFVEAAKFLPDTEFVLIGKHMDDSISHLKSIAGPNVTFTGFISKAELLSYLQQAKVYVQASYHEGFGISVAEAMLCEAVPVVTNQFALPEVVGDCGYYCDYGDIEQLAAEIKNALNAPPELGQRARKRIIENYSLEKRGTSLIEAVNGVINK